MIASLLLTLIALLLGLLFVFRANGGTLFLFSAVAPVLVLVAIAIYLGTVIFEFRQTHKLFSVERYPAGSTIFRQGDPGDCAYFMRDGTVEVVDEEAGSVLTTLGSGELFGEIALLTDAPRTATVRALSPVEVAVLGKENFLNMMRLMPATEEEILNTVQTRVMRDRQRNQDSPS
jgi:CRP-like cAMP-binding protein